eukprot:9605745-Karenia_brevis.AAC.1
MRIHSDILPFHAAQLRAITFAENSQPTFVMGCCSQHETTSNINVTKDNEELREERWLDCHDRRCARIPGLLPLVFDSPIRLTEAINANRRKMGMFKHAHSVL